VAGTLGLATAVLFSSQLGVGIPWPTPAVAVYRAAANLRIANGYGLFAVMTTVRHEVIVEGSADGRTWRAYGFKWKPGDLAARPAFVAPHMPRLDWQMWFAALGTAEENPWCVAFCARLLQGEPSVLRLLAANPFPGAPPRYVRARLATYRFTRGAGSRAWWTATPAGDYLAPISLKPSTGSGSR